MKVGTHDGKFHADDVFALAVMYQCGLVDSLVRTRDAKKLTECDIRIDVGGKFNPASADFDHHQKGGAGVRQNGVPFAAFGLIWREYGVRRCGSAEIHRLVDEKLVQPVDARDCGYMSQQSVAGLPGYSISDAILSMNPTWRESINFDRWFMPAVRLAMDCITREIIQAEAIMNAKSKVLGSLSSVPGTRILALDCCCPWKDTVVAECPDILYVVYPYETGDRWMVEAVPLAKGAQAVRAQLPQQWAGWSGAEIAQVTGVEDAIFCHPARFVAGAWSMTGALKLAQLALQQ